MDSSLTVDSRVSGDNEAATVVVVSSPHRSPRCGVLDGAVHNHSTVSVVSFHIAGTLRKIYFINTLYPYPDTGEIFY